MLDSTAFSLPPTCPSAAAAAAAGAAAAQAGTLREGTAQRLGRREGGPVAARLAHDAAQGACAGPAAAPDHALHVGRGPQGLCTHTEVGGCLVKLPDLVAGVGAGSSEKLANLKAASVGARRRLALWGSN